MNFRPTTLDGVILVEPDVHRDARGFFLETYHAEKYARSGIAADFVQHNHSRSVRGTLRGLHAQWRRPQGKLVRCLSGAIFDVAADMRVGSPTRGRWTGATLTSETHHQLWVPPGFLHGFLVLSEVAEVEYMCTDLYDPGYELGVRWDDPEIGIEWPLPAEQVILSAKDEAAPRLAEVPREHLPVWTAP